MGLVSTIDHDKFPEQSQFVGKRVDVTFNYDQSRIVHGVCVRDDSCSPWLTIFHLDDGRYVLSTECQYAFA